jgi:hypothetical protein
MGACACVMVLVCVCVCDTVCVCVCVRVCARRTIEPHLGQLIVFRDGPVCSPIQHCTCETEQASNSPTTLRFFTIVEID